MLGRNVYLTKYAATRLAFIHFFCWLRENTFRYWAVDGLPHRPGEDPDPDGGAAAAARAGGSQQSYSYCILTALLAATQSDRHDGRRQQGRLSCASSQFIMGEGETIGHTVFLIKKFQLWFWPFGCVGCAAGWLGRGAGGAAGALARLLA